MIIAVENHAFAHQHMHPGIKQVEGKAPVFRQQIPGAFNKTVHLLNRTAMLQNPERRKSEGKLLITLKRVDVRHMGNNVVDSPRPCLVGQHRDFVPDHVNRMKFKIRMLLGNRQQNPPGAGADFNHPVVVQPALVFRQQTAVKSNVFLAFLVKNVIKFRSVFYIFSSSPARPAHRFTTPPSNNPPPPAAGKHCKVFYRAFCILYYSLYKKQGQI